MARGNVVVEMAHLLVEGTKLNQFVAHHIGIGRQAALHTVHGIGHHVVPILLLKVHNLERQAIFARRGLRELNVLFGRARKALALHAYANVEQVGAQTLLAKQVGHHAAVYSA